ncbi:Do family serine endopeptidase [Arenibaculum sp.]|jgi:serine protease Do|uniref:Do family serine endopeptidase n=1 Tax=Arenibaculum sp. TaxID=2865862 RepID=UPI002E1648D4|nr:Do family serine endopeptidase [Arenibaculum sp.]
MRNSPFASRLRRTTAPVQRTAVAVRRTTALVLCAGMLASFGAATVPPAATAAVPPALLEQHGSFADLVEAVMPAVVNVSTVRKAGPEVAAPSGAPYEEFFRRFGAPTPHGPEMPGREGVAQGSGFVIDPSGYVVTNNHVIDGAGGIEITLSDGTTLPAKLIGTDPKTDVALLKVEPEKPLPHVEFADSDATRVGDVVVAIGNPFGLGGTVTAGILSARSRDINAGPYDDFLQIDAAINRGNSGGPTFDMSGKVVGINTAIFSPSGGSVGIGFAIPANLAMPVIAQLRETGSVERGWIGVQIQPVTPEIAESLGAGDLEGALVADVVDDGPADRADLQPGDVIVSVAGKPVKDLRDVTRAVAATKPGGTVELGLYRQGETETVDLAVGTMPGDPVKVASAGEAPSDKAALGLQLSALDEQMRQRLGLGEDVSGVVVVGAGEGANAEKVRPGDVITSVGRDPVSSPAEVAAKVEEAEKAGRKSLLVRLHRGGTEQFVALEITRA